jgi:hypothetical protein
VRFQKWLVEFQKWLVKSVALICRYCYDGFINQEGFTMIVTKQLPTQQFLNNYSGHEVFYFKGAFTVVGSDGLCYSYWDDDYFDSETVWSELSENDYVIVVTNATCCVLGMTLSQVNDHNKEVSATKDCAVDGVIRSNVVTKFWKEVV